MQHEVLCGLLDAPSPESAELQDSQPLLRSIVWPPVRREAFALCMEDLHLPAEQVPLRGFLIPLDQQPKDG